MTGAFRKRLLEWYQEVRRDLPWRRASETLAQNGIGVEGSGTCDESQSRFLCAADPYRIWISEIMLQQTRVAAVIPYYEKFLARFPSISALAEAPESDLLAHWAGLGYYTRARNLQKAARQMPDGVFPSTYEKIRALPGIGDYTAAAVASISFQLPYAVVDGNVLRVIARLTNDDSNIADAATRKRFATQAQQMLDLRQPGEYNQAIMELGATVCTPRNPRCGECPVSRWCEARVAGTQSALPVKVRKQKQERIELLLLVIENPDGAVLLKPSARVDGFWDLPEHNDLPEAVVGEYEASFSHQITFRKYLCRVARASVGAAPVTFRWSNAGLPVSTIAEKSLRKLRHPLHKKR